VLVLGGSGGTGTTGIQLAKAFGAGQVTTTTSADNFDYVKLIGADVAIDYKTANWWDPSVVADDSIDVVYDCVGQEVSQPRMH
jgi:NADPH2:quinone reductase